MNNISLDREEENQGLVTEDLSIPVCLGLYIPEGAARSDIREIWRQKRYVLGKVTRKKYVLPKVCQEGDSFVERNSTNSGKNDLAKNASREEWWLRRPHGLKSVTCQEDTKGRWGVDKTSTEGSPFWEAAHLEGYRELRVTCRDMTRMFHVDCTSAIPLVARGQINARLYERLRI